MISSNFSSLDQAYMHQNSIHFLTNLWNFFIKYFKPKLLKIKELKQKILMMHFRNLFLMMHLFQFFKISLVSYQTNLILFDTIDTWILNFRLPKNHKYSTRSINA
jgi:hypothetical protein